jgi:YVTN family beta-propeller protein
MKFKLTLVVAVVVVSVITHTNPKQLMKPSYCHHPLILPLLILAFSLSTFAQTPQTVTLPNGWSLSPAGKSIPLGDLPLNLIVSPSKKYLAVTNNGQSKQHLQLIDLKTQTECDRILIPKSWLGLAFSQNEKYLYASGANDNCIQIYSIQNRKLIHTDSLILGKPYPTEKICPTGIALDESRNRLYAVTKENNSLYILSLATKSILKVIPLSGEAYQCVLSPSKSHLYISVWGNDQIAVFDTQSDSLTQTIPVGDNPNDLTLSKNGKTLFVANANDNSISVVDVTAGKTIETIQTSLYPNAPIGSTPNAVALSADEKTLFVANADNNCLAVLDVQTPGATKTKGFIPTGWYPTSVKVIGNKLYVANGKGMSSLPNPNGPRPISKQEQSAMHQQNERQGANIEYIGGLFKGTLSIINLPNETQLKIYTKSVFRNTPYTKERELLTAGEPGNPIPQKVGDPSPIQYVFYIIKENRTYDQVLGDIKEGNGDSSLCLFPEPVTPNQHALVKEFVLLDNFYVDAEVSADGHNWSTAAYANDYTEKTWPTSYGRRGGSYDYEGSRKIAYPKEGFIWDHCRRAGITYRTYGEFADNKGANIPALEEHFCKAFPGYNLDIKDMDRVDIWKKDFDSLIAINALPRFNSIRLGNDHTYGARVGKPTPTAMVAENDLAVGRFIDYLSKSSVWQKSAVFILEDDAQNGSDHVDAHRSTAYIISPYTKRKTVIHSPYSTSSMLRTIELILGIKPMSQYDAAAPSMWNCFTKTPDFTPFTHKATQTDLDAKNTAYNKSAQQSESFNLTDVDAAPDLDFNQVIWKTVRGESSTMPPPRHAVFLTKPKQNSNSDNDD